MSHLTDAESSTDEEPTPAPPQVPSHDRLVVRKPERQQRDDDGRGQPAAQLGGGPHSLAKADREAVASQKSAA